MNDQKQPTHGAVPIPLLSKIISYFKTTPMAYDVSSPFIELLTTVPIISLSDTEAGTKHEVPGPNTGAVK
jgi:hypothetical protein